MIVFDLKCGEGHVFEAWFNSSSGFEEQRAAGLISCPTCGNARVEKAVMAPNVGAKGNQRSSDSALPARTPEPTMTPMTTPMPAPPPEVMAKAMAMVAEAQAKMLKESKWVGSDFSKQARAMHEGEVPQAPIHGQATREEVEALVEDDVPVLPLLVPFTPPDQLN